MVADEHWKRWHESYDDPESSLSHRLTVVRRRLAEALARTAPGPIRLVSMCAGEGRDVIPVLASHPRGPDVTARLVELDDDLAATARAAAEVAGLGQVEVVPGDASITTAYAGAVPAEIVMACGVFGNITTDDIRRTISELPRLSAPGATVMWTRHRRPPDLTPTIRSWFDKAGFLELAFDTEAGFEFSVGTTRLADQAREFRAGVRMFTFIGNGEEAHA